MSSENDGFESELAFYSIVFLIIFLLLCLIHKFRLLGSIYFAKDDGKKTHAPTGKFFAWLTETFKTRNSSVLKQWGTDGAAMLIFMDLSIKFFVFGTLILSPLFIVHVAIDYPEFQSFPMYKISKISHDYESYVYCWHVLSVYFIVGLFYRLVYSGYQAVFQAKEEVSKVKWDSSCVTVLQNIPDGTTNEGLKNSLENLKIGKIINVIVLKKHPKLQKALEERWDLILEIENLALKTPIEDLKDLILEILGPESEVLKQFKSDELKKCPKNIPNNFEKLREKLIAYREADSLVDFLRANFDEEAVQLNTALVRFVHPSCASLASRALLSSKLNSYNIKPAPFSQDFLPISMLHGVTQKYLRRITCIIVITFLIILTYFLTKFLGFLPKYLRKITFINDYPILKNSVDLVPVWCVKLYMMLIPIVFSYITPLCSFTSLLRAEIVSFLAYVLFLLVNLVFVNGMGTILDDLIPFFVNFVLFQSFISCPLLPVQIGGVFYKLLQKFKLTRAALSSPRHKRQLMLRPVLQLIQISPTVFTVMVGLIFSIRCPFFNILMVFFCIIAKIAWKYRLMYQVRVSDSRGKLWYNIVKLMQFAIFVSIAMLGYEMYIKEFKVLSFLLCPMIPIFWHANAKNSELGERLTFESLELWRDFDREAQNIDCAKSLNDNIDDDEENPLAYYQGYVGITAPGDDKYENVLLHGRLPSLWLNK